jgi:hypothetical protein
MDTTLKHPPRTKARTAYPTNILGHITKRKYFSRKINHKIVRDSTTREAKVTDNLQGNKNSIITDPKEKEIGKLPDK